MFFYERAESTHMKRAFKVCAECPVKLVCFDYSIRTHEKFGVFGGKSDLGRRKWRLFVRKTRTEFEQDICGVVESVSVELVMNDRLLLAV